MSQTHRQTRANVSDFSIARILAADTAKKKSRESFLAEGASFGPRKVDEEFFLCSEGRRDERAVSFPQRESKHSADSLGSFGLAADRVYPSFANSAGTTGGDSRDERIFALRSSPESSLARTARELKTVKIERSELSWLQCTRYRPPKLPRKSVAGKSGKRRPGAHPRIPFTATQLRALEDKYRGTAYLSRRDVIQLSTALRLPQSRIKIWFQNRRARDRRESAIYGSDHTVLSPDAPSTDKSKGLPGWEPVTPSLV